jgi:Skp family chaperone for outer membrane proteins
MTTMRTLVFGLLLSLGLAACSKKEVAVDASDPAAGTNADQVTAETPPAEPAPAEAPPAQDVQVVEVIAQDLNAVPETLEKQNYDGAVDALTAAKLTAGTPEQVKAYREQLYRAIEYLQKKAETDAKAQEAYQRLGKQMMGR